MTMDRSEGARPKDKPFLFIPKHHKVTFGNMDSRSPFMADIRYPVLSSHPKFRSNHMVLEEKSPFEIYGTDKPTIEHLREQEERVLGVLDFHSPVSRDDWKLSFKGDPISRGINKNWHGRFVDALKLSQNDNNVKKDTKVKFGGNPSYAPGKAEVHFAEKSYNEKYVYTPRASGHYIERSFNPRTQRQTKNKTTDRKYVENSFNPHYHNKKPHYTMKDQGYYDKVAFDPSEKFNVRYLPPVKRTGKYADVTSKVQSFSNMDYEPGGGTKIYPTYEVKWKTGAKVRSLSHFKNKSFPKIETGSLEIRDSYSQATEMQSKIELDSLMEEDMQNVSSVTQSVQENQSTADAKSIDISIANSQRGTLSVSSPRLSTETNNIYKRSSIYSSKSRSSRFTTQVPKLHDIQNRGNSHLGSKVLASHVNVSNGNISIDGSQEKTQTQDTNLSKYDDTDNLITVSSHVEDASENLTNDHNDNNPLRGNEDDDVKTESDVASLPKFKIFQGTSYSNTSSMNSKSPISRFQKPKISESQNTATATSYRPKPFNMTSHQLLKGPAARRNLTTKRENIKVTESI
ncbi:unnamed protein product [Mytilus coruscus]|uniref:Uncharacterized protein n=1 Tax=Mytilus coruscus TaxID=42192 RepID=A0A6J8DT79_MYTCO|nr:unnamed protein product [Mytilus coruscus]